MFEVLLLICPLSDLVCDVAHATIYNSLLPLLYDSLEACSDGIYTYVNTTLGIDIVNNLNVDLSQITFWIQCQPVSEGI